MSSLRQLGRYRIETFKGSRGEADAYRAFDMIRKRTVLLLTLKPEVTANPQRLGRILNNAQAVFELVHPRLGWVWETGEEEGITYVAERHVNGPSLRERLDESGALSWEEAAQALEQLAQGLDFLHNSGRVHGALRPENIILSPEVGVVLGGLGIPETPLTLSDLETPEEATRRVPNGSVETGDDAVSSEQAGKPDPQRLPEPFAAAPYTAPEVWMGEAPSPASDQYALACVLVEMLSGKPLFAGATAAEVCERSLEGPTLPASWPQGTPWQIEPVLERALRQQPAERFASAGEFAAAPARLAARPVTSEDERRLREAQRQARLEAEAQVRRQAEEAERLAALERARREVEEQARLAVEAQAAAAAAVSAPLVAGAVTEAAKDAETGLNPEASAGPVGAARRRTPAKAAADTVSPSTARPAPRAARRLRWPFWMGAALLFALAWFWGSGRIFGGGVAATATDPGPAVTQPAVVSPATTLRPTQTAAPSRTATETPAPTATLTRRPTNTATRTASPTATLTATETERPRTPTRTRRIDDGPDR